MDYPKLKVKDEDEAVIVLKELYRTYGYRPFKMRKFEEYDLYVENKNFLVSDDIITFSDFNGKLMALKPDVTLSIIKSVKPSDGTEKVFYHENVYRTLKNTREVREILQMGLECIGEVGVYETAEVLGLAAESLGRLTDRYFIDISHMGFVYGLLSAAGLDFSQRAKMMKHLKEKNPHDLMRICREAGTDDSIAAKLCRTASLWGPFDAVLPQLKEISVNAETEAAICELEAVYDILKVNGNGSRMRLDFSVINDMNYYNAFVFQGFVEGVPINVLSGGRYDKLLERFGKNSGAIGFAVYLGLLWQYAASPRTADADAAIYYDSETDLGALAETVKRLAGQGISTTVRRKGGGRNLKCVRNYEMRGGRLEEL